MRVVESNIPSLEIDSLSELSDSLSQVLSANILSTNEPARGHQSYFELAETPLVEMDVTEQLRMNLNRLSDLQGRMGFLMREIRGLMKA
jgi:hypothetical protein